MSFPSVYRDMLADISEGQYGPELQEIYNNTPYAAINGGYVVYVCSGCSTWETDIDVSMYAPNEPDSIPQKQYGIKTAAEWGYVPYVMPRELGKEYHLVRRHYHRCKKCGKRMHKASSMELRNLPCPECGRKTQAQVIPLIWD